MTRAVEAGNAALRGLDVAAHAAGLARGDGDKLRTAAAVVASLLASQTRLRQSSGVPEWRAHLPADERALTRDEAAAATRVALRKVGSSLRHARRRHKVAGRNVCAALAAAVCTEVGVGGTLVFPAPDVRGWKRSHAIARYLQQLPLGEFTRYLATRAARDGITVVNAVEFFSTRACWRCQHVGPPVTGRWFSCEHGACGWQSGRDANGGGDIGSHALVRGAQALAPHVARAGVLHDYVMPRIRHVVGHLAGLTAVAPA